MYVCMYALYTESHCIFVCLCCYTQTHSVCMYVCMCCYIQTHSIFVYMYVCMYCYTQTQCMLVYMHYSVYVCMYVCMCETFSLFLCRESSSTARLCWMTFLDASMSVRLPSSSAIFACRPLFSLVRLSRKARAFFFRSCMYVCRYVKI